MHQATIGEDRGGGDVAGGVAGQEAHHLGDLLGLRHAAHGNGGVELGQQFGVVHGGVVDRRGHGAGADVDDRDAVGGQLQGRGAGEHAHAAFGAAVGGVVGHGPVLVHRRDVDDAAAAALGDHLLGGELGGEEDAAQVDVEHLVEVVRGGGEDRGARFDAGVVDHHVQPAVFGHGGIHQALQVVELANIGLNAEAAAAIGADLPLQLFGGLGVGAVVDHHLGAEFGQILDDGFADTAIATGDDGDLALQKGREGLAGQGVGAGHGVMG